MKNKINYIIFMGLLSCACVNDTNLALRNDILPEELNSKSIDNWCVKCQCKDTLVKKLIFDFVYDKELPQESENTLFIIREGILYKGEIKNKITLSDVCFCMDNNLTKINSLSFALIDRKHNRVYYWSKKESYYLFDKNTVYVKLGIFSQYKIKFDNDFYFK